VAEPPGRGGGLRRAFSGMTGSSRSGEGHGESLEARFSSPEEASRAERELRLAGFEAVEVETEPAPVLDVLVPTAERQRPTRVRVRPEGRPLEAAVVLARYGGSDPEPQELRIEHRVPTGEPLELVEEEASPRVVTVPVGEVRVRKVVVTEERTLTVTVAREEVVVERTLLPADAEVGAHAGGPVPSRLGGDEEVIRIPVYEERVLVEKRPFVREEVVVRKRRVPQEVAVETEVRREQPVVERVGRAMLDDRTGGPAARRRSGKAPTA
jgi:uncharacterized protein (TIGR02271 family)